MGDYNYYLFCFPLAHSKACIQCKNQNSKSMAVFLDTPTATLDADLGSLEGDFTAHN